ncbi:hypothetical protein [Flavobacterium foetidum]|uniref:hypothetical protein n=1 Tax=Flavobacterium foetidum TaxID=2026681 RepID=UPI0010755144|nr:hypothetical protein [Flavobacterium foetidum]KAF2517779.1 hypothetical protein E0W73_00815 [Flavobacterium foetidum]
MKKLGIIIFLGAFFAITSCSNDRETTQQEDFDKLNKMHQELRELSQVDNYSCTDPKEWTFVKIGDKCGGEENILYSKKINTEAFLTKANLYRKYFERYKKKWGFMCGAYLIYWGPPSGIECYENKPRFVYAKQFQTN